MFDLRKLIGKRGSSNGSISGSIQHMDDLTNLYEMALGCLSDAIHSIGEHAPDTPRALRDEHRKNLKQIRGLLATPGEESLETAGKHLEAELHVYGRNLEKYIHQQGKEVKEIMSMTADLVDAAGSREQECHSRFRAIARRLRQIVSARDLGEVRAKLAAEVEQLERCVEEMARESEGALGRARRQFQAKEAALGLEDSSGSRRFAAGSQGREHRTGTTGPWVDNSIDPITLLSGRPEAMAVIAKFKSTDARFCLAGFSVHQFDQLLTRYGRRVMDAVLKEVAFRIKEGFPEAAAVVRWNDAEFLAFSELPLPELAVRATEVERRLSLTFAIPGSGERIVVGCRSGVVQALRSETAAEMIARTLSNQELVSN